MAYPEDSLLAIAKIFLSEIQKMIWTNIQPIMWTVEGEPVNNLGLNKIHAILGLVRQDRFELFWYFKQ